MDDQKRTILLVEDEVIIALTEKMQLENAGYCVLHVSNGETAVATICGDSQPVDLILMDIDLGSGIDGTQAAKRILDHKDIPLIFLSSHTEPEIVEKTEKITSYGYIVKNSGFTVLDASIKMAFRLFHSREVLKEKERALSYQHDFMGYVIEHNRSAIAVHDKGLRYIYVSKRYLETYRVKDHNVIGKHHYEVFPDLPQKFRDAHQKALNGEISSAERDPYERGDGTIDWTRWECRPWYAHDGSIGGIIVYTEVITDKINAEERYRTFVDHLPGIVYTFSTERGGTFWSKPVLPILGYTPEELKADPFIWNDSIHPEDAPRVKHAMDDHGKGADYSIEYRVQAKDGHWVWLHDRFIYKSIKDNETVIHGFAIDITDRKNAEEKLAQKEGELREAHHIARIGRWDYWHREDRLSWSPLIYEFFELEEDRFGASYDAFLSSIHPGDREAVDKAWRESLVNQHPYEIDHRLLMGDGRVKWVREYCRTTFDESRQAILSTGIVQDITEGKEGEQKLAEEKQYLETILETTADGFWVVMPDRTIALANDSYCKMTGYTRNELTCMLINDIDAIEDPQETVERIERIMKNGSETFETLHRCKDGKILEVEVSVSRLDRTDGVYLICFCRDISDRKQAEIDIQKQLSEKEVLLKEVHHRIKNNIASIEKLLELQIDSATNAEVIAALKEALIRVNSMRILYEKLLLGKDYCDVSTKEYIESLTKAVVEVYSDSQKVIIENQIMDIPLDTKKLIPLGIIINELMTNIFKYAFKGMDNGHVSITLDATDNYLTLTLQDNGMGIDERVISNTSPGFGLTIVKLLAEQLDGTYTIENDKGTKSVLRFEL